MDYYGNGEDSSSCLSSVVTAATLATRTPFTARLTPDMLQRHEKRAEGKGHFAGDKLAKIVIRKKTQYELAKEQKKRTKQISQFQSFLTEEDGHVEAVLVQGNNDATFGGKSVRWVDEELKGSPSTKSRRTRSERQERSHGEQSEVERQAKLKAAELFRQRNLRAAELLHQSRLQGQDQPRDELATLVNSMLSLHEPEIRRLVSPPSTPKARRSTGTLIDI
jgi:hypothetical protein